MFVNIDNYHLRNWQAFIKDFSFTKIICERINKPLFNKDLYVIECLSN